MNRQQGYFQQQLNPQQIVQAFQIILTSQNNKQLIKQADAFIQQCEKNQKFALVLMKIFSQIQSHEQKWQILIHLKNVIKRNWTTKRRSHEVNLKEETKQQIKNRLIQLYKVSWDPYYKQFNLIFGVIAKYQFPNNYPAFKNFILEILRTLGNSDIQTLLTPKQVLPYLSLVKTIFKGDSGKRFNPWLNTQQGFKKHIVQPISLSVMILQKIDSSLKNFQKMNQNEVQPLITEKLFECSRKVDKIILYCMQYTVSSLQKDSNLIKIANYFVKKLELLLTLRSQSTNHLIQLNILAILQGLSNLQTTLPFLFTSFLTEYFSIIIRLLVQQNFENQKLIYRIITANSKPLVTFSYYTTQEQFKNSIQVQKGSGSNFRQQQKSCHEQFRNTYAGSNSVAFMQKWITQLMQKCRKGRQQEQFAFEDGEQVQNLSQYNAFQLVQVLLKNLIIRFKSELKPFINKMIDHILTQKLTSNSSSVISNMYEVIILFPKTIQQNQFDHNKIAEVLTLCYQAQDFIMFSRVFKAYSFMLNEDLGYQCFGMLADIVACESVNHKVTYQCALSIKKILSQSSQDENSYPIQKLGPCISRLLTLLPIHKAVPTHLWNILQLITQILRLTNSEIVLTNLPYFIDNLNALISQKNNDETTINAVSQLLQHILELIADEQQLNSSPNIKIENKNGMLEVLYDLAINFVGINITNPKVQSPAVLFDLWFSVARSADASKISANFAQKLIQTLSTFKDHLMKQDPILRIMITQQYMLGKVITLNSQNIIQITQQHLQSCQIEHRNRTMMGIFSLYFSYYLTYKQAIPQMLTLGIQQIIQYYNKISQYTNILRTMIMLTLNHHIVELGASYVFGVFTDAVGGDYRQWMRAYIWSLEYQNHKYASKVGSMAMLSSIDLLHSTNILTTPIQQHIPLQQLLKVISFQIEPVNMIAASTSYASSHKTLLQSMDNKVKNKFGFSNNIGVPRKFKLHLKREWAECDLRPVFREKFLPILGSLGWNEDVLKKTFDNPTYERIYALLANKQQKKQ